MPGAFLKRAIRFAAAAILVLFVHSAGVFSTPAVEEPSESPLPKVLLIGDSISIGYTETVQKTLAGKAVVERNPGNAAHSRNGVEKLDEWLGDEDWAVIHFNHGLHDLKYVDKDEKNTRDEATGRIQIPVEEYEANLEKIVLRLKETGAKILFATTTPFPDRPEGPLREALQTEIYNEAALRVMRKHEVAVNDLYSFALPKLAEIQRPDNVHFTPKGSEILGREVARQIEKLLP